MQKLSIISANANNFQNLFLELPVKSFISVTGQSGSGKTTLLRDILFSEWKRRIVGDLSFAPKLIKGLPPIVYFGNTRPPRTRSLVNDGMDIAPLLLELVLRRGEAKCVKCGGKILHETFDSLYLRLSQLVNSTVVVGVEIGKIPDFPRDGLRVFVESDIRSFEDLDEKENSGLYVALDLVKVSHLSKSRLLELLKYSLTFSPDHLALILDGTREDVYLTPKCAVCKFQQRPIDRKLLSTFDMAIPELMTANLFGQSVKSLLSIPIKNLLCLLDEAEVSVGLQNEIFISLKRQLGRACEIGIGYLSLDRRLRTLSSGEFQRVKLVQVLGEAFYGSLFALDEPESGLSPKDIPQLKKIFSKLVLEGNSVVVATHSEALLAEADQVVELSNGAVTFQGSAYDFATVKTVSIAPQVKRPEKLKDLTEFFKLSNINVNNLRGVDCKIPAQALVCLFGVSGSGKSSLALQALLPLAAKIVKDRSAVAQLEIGELTLSAPVISRVVSFKPTRFFSLRRMQVAAALGIVPIVKELFSRTELARVRGYSNRDFNLISPSLDVSKLRFKGVAFSEIGAFSINEALELFVRIPKLAKRLKAASEMGIGHLKLNQPVRELSAGEEQRLNLANRIALLGDAKTLFVLDEPLNGLSNDEQRRVLEVLRRLVTAGHSVMIVEHSPLALEAADFKIEIGPGAGDEGGRVVTASASGN
jgi:excinuclease UvrABC ATPase subunit